MPHPATQARFCTQFDGYIGMWHKQGAFFPTYGPKYGGGLGTYNAKHRPLAVYAPAVEKTFFCWGGTTRGSYRRERYFDFQEGNLLHMVSYFDHRTGKVPKPTVVFDKWCGDPHDNPVLQIDGAGYLWLFSPSHGPWTTPAYVHRSAAPYAIDRWETVYVGDGNADALFAYPQPWYDPARGFIFMHTIYGGGRAPQGRALYVRTSTDGRAWTQPLPLAHIAQGHYQVTAHDPGSGVVATAFNYHPEEGGLEARTNLYYAQSRDGGASWTTIEGAPLALPLTTVDNPALIWDAEAAGLKVYMKDLIFDDDGHPVIVVVTSRGHEPGPENGPHTWRFARWTGDGWAITEGMVSDNNYDMGTLTIEGGVWTLLAPTEPGPQRYNPGGEVALWRSEDAGASWTKVRQLTHDSPRNHTYVRRPLHAHPDFYAFWADGDARAPSPSYLYFTNRAGDRVWRLPPRMDGDVAAPEVVG
jgi:hypothetical protein